MRLLFVLMLSACGSLTLPTTKSTLTLPPGTATGSTTVIPPGCGDGVVDATEDCDDAGQSADCDIDCTTAQCGDGQPNAAANEDCDEGGDTEACDGDCTDVQCGDGYINAVAEFCDTTVELYDCDLDCTEAECGDGTWNITSGEACDDAGFSASCDDDCTPVQCGDGVFNPSAEDCDDGGSAICDNDCTFAACGDGLANPLAGETCDDGNLIPGDGCDGLCQSEGPTQCQGGNDPISGDPWVVCSVTPTTAWISHVGASGGTYQTDQICTSLGYNIVSQYGGNCGDVCGYCEGAITSCSANGTRTFEGSNSCAFPQMCFTVTWECSL